MPSVPERSTGYYDLTFSTFITGNTSWTSAHVFCFQGTDNIGTPVGIMFICGYVDAGATIDVRIYDVTNNAVVIESLGISNAFPSAVDLGAPANLSVSPVVWEVQIKKNGNGPKEVAIASGCMRF